MIETWFNQDTQQAVKVRYIDGNVFSLDNNGNKVGVNMFTNGEPSAISGTISASVIRADGATVAVSGSSEGNRAWVILPQAACAVPGVISIVIKATSEGNITTLCAAVSNVYLSSTDSVVDPGTIIPSIEALIAAIDAAVASWPLDYSYVSAIAEATLHNVEWEQGSISTTSGNTATSTYTIRTTERFPIEAFIQASATGAVKVQAGCWDINGTWLGKTSTAGLLTKANIITAYSTVAFVRVLARHSSEQAITPADVLTYNIVCAVSQVNMSESSEYELPTFLDIKNAFDNNGVLSSSLTKSFLTNSDRSIVCMFNAQYTGTDKPYFYYRLYTADGTRLLTGQTYYFEGKNEPIKQSFRIPNSYAIAKVNIVITIPSGSTLSVTGFNCYYEESVRKGTGNIIFHAHRGFDRLFPPGSYNAIVSAAEIGSQSCVAIPKFTLDGVAVEFHDDSSISGQITQMDGTAIPSQYDVSIGQLTYDQLMQWSIGYSFNPVFASAKILLMEDFFRICAETGMRPVFSIHSADAPTDSEWQTLAAMMNKYRQIPLLSVKTGVADTWKKVVDNVGDVYSLIWLYSTTSTYDILDTVSSAITTSGVDRSKTRIDCEFFLDGLESATYGEIQTAQLQAAFNAGYTISVVLDGTATSDTLRKYMDMGVTEFTNRRHTCIGLNW